MSDDGAEYSTREATGVRWVVVGTGFVGSAVATHLRSRGFEVTEVSAPRLTAPVGSSIATLLAAAADEVDARSELVAAFDRADVVVNAAGVAQPGSSADERLYGANALLPLVVRDAAREAGAGRLIHLSSVAAQGRMAVLDESPSTNPFSPYSASKALGESGLLAVGHSGGETFETVIIRATSVQGDTRPTTIALRQLARSRAASVAGSGDAPTVVSSIDGLVEFVEYVGSYEPAPPAIVIQPWEGASCASVLRAAGGREPLHLPSGLARLLVATVALLGRVLPKFASLARRLELMWFGQRQVGGWAEAAGFTTRPDRLLLLLRGPSDEHAGRIDLGHIDRREES